MIPIRDNIAHKSFPWINTALIVANVAVFLHEIALARSGLLERFIFTYGVVPARLTLSEFSSYHETKELLTPLFTSLFLHGGWLHIFGNMLSLYIFGDNVEDRLGHVRYLFFYLFCGLGAGLTHVLTNSSSGVPTIGASGAIAGVMGAYFVLYPRAKVLTLIPILFFFDIVEIPAFFFLGFWFLLQFFIGTFSIVAGGQSGGGVAWWAHVGGFALGIVVLPLLVKRPPRRRHQDQAS